MPNHRPARTADADALKALLFPDLKISPIECEFRLLSVLSSLYESSQTSWNPLIRWFSASSFSATPSQLLEQLRCLFMTPAMNSESQRHQLFNIQQTVTLCEYAQQHWVTSSAYNIALVTWWRTVTGQAHTWDTIIDVDNLYFHLYDCYEDYLLEHAPEKITELLHYKTQKSPEPVLQTMSAIETQSEESWLESKSTSPLTAYQALAQRNFIQEMAIHQAYEDQQNDDALGEILLNL